MSTCWQIDARTMNEGARYESMKNIFRSWFGTGSTLCDLRRFVSGRLVLLSSLPAIRE